MFIFNLMHFGLLHVPLADSSCLLKALRRFGGLGQM